MGKNSQCFSIGVPSDFPRSVLYSWNLHRNPLLCPAILSAWNDNAYNGVFTPRMHLLIDFRCVCLSKCKGFCLETHLLWGPLARLMVNKPCGDTDLALLLCAEHTPAGCRLWWSRWSCSPRGQRLPLIQIRILHNARRGSRLKYPLTQVGNSESSSGDRFFREDATDWQISRTRDKQTPVKLENGDGKNKIPPSAISSVASSALRMYFVFQQPRPKR